MKRLKLRLRLVESGDLREAWEVRGTSRVGRSDQVDIRLSDASISRAHADITYDGTAWVVIDLGSRNGTYLNGTRVTRVPRRLRERDLLQFGNVVVAVEAALVPSDADESRLQMTVQAATRQSPSQAADVLATEVTRSNRPGEQLMSLLRVGQGLDRLDSLDVFLTRSLRDAVEALKARQGAITLPDSSSSALDPRVTFHRDETVTPDKTFSRTLAARCLREGHSLLYADALGESDGGPPPSVIGGAAGSVICALLRTTQHTLGVLQLDRGVEEPPFTEDDLRRADALALHFSSFIDNALFLEESQRRLFIQTIIAFSQVIELRDEYTGGHTHRVTEYSLLLAKALRLGEAETNVLRIGAPLHDIGKVGIDDNVLRKPGKLTAAEFEQMKTHTLKGVAILKPFRGLDGVIPIVRSHHERWDGYGYPDRLAGTAIPLAARLVAVADAFDAMTSDRPYRRGLAAGLAYEQIERGAGTQFDPECAAAFLRVRNEIEEVRRYRPGNDSAQGIDVGNAELCRALVF